MEKRVDDIIPPLQAIADAENTSLVQLLLIVLVKLCRRIGLSSLAKLLYTVFISLSDIKSSTMSMEKSAYMMVSQELGRDRYTELRSTLMSEGFEPKPWYKVNAHCEDITPERIPVILHQDEGVCGYRFSFKEVCKYVVNRSFLAADIGSGIPDRIFIAGKDGTDGSGQHYCRATVHVAVKGNILLYSFTPLKICAGDNAEGAVLWRNTAPNSAYTQRPLAVIGAKEDTEDILRPFIPQIEKEITAVTKDGFTMSCMGKDIHVMVETDLAMFDGKMQSALQGTGGAFCQLCMYSKNYCHCILNVNSGFPINRKIEDMHTIFSILTEDGTMTLSKKPGDYGTRAGVTTEPITHRDLNAGISVTHAWLRCASWFLNLLYHLAANDYTWGFGNKVDLRHKKLMKAKEKVQDTFTEVLGIKIDAADGTGHSGNSLNGKLAKRMFDES